MDGTGEGSSAYRRSLRRWFDARALYGAEGEYPGGITSAFRALPNMVTRVGETLASLAPQRPLEIGPGDRPLIASLPEPSFLDLVPGFLRRLPGRKTIGDIRMAPFRADAFDLVVCNDVFTHIPAGDRARALSEIGRIAPTALVFNPELGTPDVRGSSVPTLVLTAGLEAAGMRCHVRGFVAKLMTRDYPMSIIVARRAAV